MNNLFDVIDITDDFVVDFDIYTSKKKESSIKKERKEAQRTPEVQLEIVKIENFK